LRSKRIQLDKANDGGDLSGCGDALHPPGSMLKSFLERRNARLLAAYRELPSLIEEHRGIEQTVLAGGYGYRQVMELIQNGADAILEACEEDLPPASGNLIHVLLQESFLYVANTGARLGEKGVDALLSSHSSTKRGNQIGRFGLGFKSLLRLGGRIELFTKDSGGLQFDPERCRRELQNEFGLTDTPGLRLAWPLDAAQRASDPVLERLSWAETIVRVEIRSRHLEEHLRAEIRTFPCEFLLFLPVPVTLRFEDGTDPIRELRVEKRGDECLLRTGQYESLWRVVSREVITTDDRARSDATDIHARKSVPLAWAVPLAGKREESGCFWAFFPTQTPTYIPGILNAPWKLNSDRNALIAGEWNTALMHEAAQLVIQTLPHLSTAEDPGRPLDAFPRQLQRKDEDSAPLVEALWTAIERAAVVPDALANLRLGRELSRHPRDTPGLARLWMTLASDEQQSLMVHPSCMDRQRASRLKFLAERLGSAGAAEPLQPNLREHQVDSWFAMVASVDVESAIVVLKLAAAYSNDCKALEWNSIRPLLRIIPSDQGQLLTAANVVFAPAGTGLPDGRQAIARMLCSDTESERILTEVMKIERISDDMWSCFLLDTLLKLQKSGSPADEEWRLFWSRLRSAPAGARHAFATRNSSRIRVRRSDRNWVLADEVLLPGALISNFKNQSPVPDTELDEITQQDGGILSLADLDDLDLNDFTFDDIHLDATVALDDVVALDDDDDDDGDESANYGLLVDKAFHEHDEDTLRLIGVTDSPTGQVRPGAYGEVARDSYLLYPWLSDCRARYMQSLNSERKPNESYVEPIGLVLPNGWTLLSNLVGIANASFTESLLSVFQQRNFFAFVKFGHATTPQAYPTVDVSHPLPWFLLRYGNVQVGDDAVTLLAVIDRCHEPALQMLENWSQLQVCLDKLRDPVPALSATQEQIQSLWRALIKAFAKSDASSGDSLRDLWAGAARDGIVPRSLRTACGNIALNEVFVTSSPHLAKRARGPDRTVVTLDEHALSLWLHNGARNLTELMKPKWVESTGPVGLLTSIVPELSEVLHDGVSQTARCRPVTGLTLAVAEDEFPLPCLMWDNTLLLDLTQLASLSRVHRLQCLLAEVAASGWLKHEPTESLRTLGDGQLDDLRANVADGSSLAERLLRAVGSRPQPLRLALGQLASMDFVQRCTPLQLAELTLAQLGPVTLAALKDTLSSEGLKPPTKWNTAEARDFVASIGFPWDFASSPETRRESEIFISGPIKLPPLHDFQKEVLQGISALVANVATRRRAVVSLPTGGGKTSVTVEAAVRLVLEPEGNRRSVLWVAQTDELCEQAVQAFRQVWVNLGAQETDLRIVRLWSGNPNPSIQELDRPIVVVASIQTLNNRMGTDGLGWLRNPGLVVVDECHHAITPSYTNLLRWLDALAPRPGAESKEEPPIIGLSATPFRTDDEESGRLARRFDNKWLPSEQDDLYARLREQGVLAHTVTEPFESGVHVAEDQVNFLLQLLERGEGIDFDRRLEAINQLLGENKQRSQRLVDRIKGANEHSILLFANSVLHAEEMSARLNLEGIAAAAINGDTPSAARRYFLTRFQSGHIRVLCNHTVLSTGFDAPRTDMVLISRAVFSPVRFLQMVGRGLRGKKNGGTSRCLIVTVVDNLGRFQDRHPYHYCQRYFKSWSKGDESGKMECGDPGSETSRSSGDTRS
jgi:superfamily II DNA or RNA helicase